MKIIYRGIRYQTPRDCYKANKDIAKVSFYIFEKRLRQGLSVEDALLIPNDRHLISFLGSHTVEGVEYPNLPSIARAYGFSISSVYQRYHRGKRGDDLVPEKRAKNYIPPEPPRSKHQIEVGGVTYKNITEACRILGVRLHTYKNRRKAGRTLEECLNVVPFVSRLKLGARRYEIDGEYLSIREMSEKFDIPEDALYQRLKSGMTAKEAVEKGPSRKGKSKESKIPD